MMTRKDFDKLADICYEYDPYTRYIDNYTQEMQAESYNRKLDNRFNDLIQNYVPDYNKGVPINTVDAVPRDQIKPELERLLAKEFSISVTPKKIWTADVIGRKIATDDSWAIRGLIAMYINLSDAKDIRFDEADRKILRDIAAYYLRKKSITDKQLRVVKKLLPKYADQLARIANDDAYLFHK